VKSKELLVGIFTVGALTLLYFGFYYLKGIDFLSSTKNYYAKYDNISQLAVSNPVLVNGFAVGRVSSIRLMPELGNKVLVEIEINNKVILGKGAKATLSSDFLGSKTILLDLGNAKSPINDKDTIQGEIAKGMLDMFSDAAEPVADNLESTLRKLNTLMDNLNTELGEVDILFKKLRATPDKINNTVEKIGYRFDDISGNIKSVAEKLNGTLTSLDPTLKNFKVLSDSLAKIKLNQTLVKATETLNTLNETLSQLKKGDNTMSKLLTEDSLYVNLNKMLNSIDSLANHFNSHPKHFLGPLGQSAKKIDRDHQKESEEQKKKGNP
jgi:phospholipid/cholesterol/gamma-HCH transport system substrate-binding protein